MEFLPLFLVLLAGVLFSALFRSFHLPWVIALVAAGIAFGPFGAGVIEINPTLEFLGQIGLIFLMFMAGLETKFSSFKNVRSGFLTIALVNGLVRFGVGFALGYLFHLGFIPSVVLGIVFVSASIAVVVPTLESRGLFHSKLGHSIVSAVILEDVASLVLLSILLQTISPTTALPLPLFYGLLFAVLVVLRFILPLLRSFFSVQKRGTGRDIFEQEVTLIFAILIGTVVIFELLGLHPIIAGFFAGLVLSDTIKSELLVEKLRTMSYGLFIPVFFIIVGLQSNPAAFQGKGNLILVISIVLVALVTKFFSGYIAGRLAGYKQKSSTIVGVATLPQLSTALAVAFTAGEYNLLEPVLVTAVVFLSLASTFIGPMTLRLLTTPGKNLKGKQEAQ